MKKKCYLFTDIQDNIQFKNVRHEYDVRVEYPLA
jgi:hypothetical protein